MPAQTIQDELDPETILSTPLRDMTPAQRAAFVTPSKALREAALKPIPGSPPGAPVPPFPT
jgi:hypothetical protein